MSTIVGIALSLPSGDFEVKFDNMNWKKIPSEMEVVPRYKLLTLLTVLTWLTVLKGLHC